MLTHEENERLTQVGPGTPMGELMRRYWHPIAATVELSKRPTKPVRILGEDLVLYRDLSGNLGLIGPRCAHRGVQLIYGKPEAEGLRCPYHGWLYNSEGQCLEQPAEPEGSRYKEKVSLKAYPVQELGGLVFAYLGPEPLPLLPRWDILVWDQVTREAAAAMLPCNWLQCMENSLDPVHNEWLHGYYGKWVLDGIGKPTEHLAMQLRAHRRIGFDRFKYGIIKRRLYEGMDDNDEHWRIGHPIIFPNTLRQGRQDQRVQFQFRVPVDDEHTWHLIYAVRLPRPGEQLPPQEVVPVKELPILTEDGWFRTETIADQDHMVFMAQGAVSDRTAEGLATSDEGIIFYRQLLEEQIRIVADGGDPIGVVRDPAENECIILPNESLIYPGDTETGGPFKHHTPEPSEVDKLVQSKKE